MLVHACRLGVSTSYARSLAEFGTPRELPNCEGWILELRIPSFPDRDAMGPYALFCCQDWSKLHADLEGVLVTSLSLVTERCVQEAV